ncbi:MAG: hypothetical protein FWD68_08690 [Alphaproteobacteria bacterium]|nr:hypothetical protein [Alphaproteobacteria bacterium]
MKIPPPPGSRISVGTDDHGMPVILIPAAPRLSRFLLAIPFLVGLLFWCAGEILAAAMIFSGKVHGFRIVFLVIWLLLWTTGGIFGAVFAFWTLRRAQPQSLRLLGGAVEFDSGRRPPCLVPEELIWGGVPNYFPRRIRHSISLRQMQGLRLRQSDAGTRLIVEIDGEVIEIAKGASDVEREWLAQFVLAHYGLTRTP